MRSIVAYSHDQVGRVRRAATQTTPRARGRGQWPRRGSGVAGAVVAGVVGPAAAPQGTVADEDVQDRADPPDEADDPPDDLLGGRQVLPAGEVDDHQDEGDRVQEDRDQHLDEQLHRLEPPRCRGTASSVPAVAPLLPERRRRQGLSESVSASADSASSASTNASGSKGARSWAPSPRPTSLTGMPSSRWTATTMPPLAVPSSLVRTRPVTPTVSVNWRAWARPFWPVVASRTSRTSRIRPPSRSRTRRR